MKDAYLSFDSGRPWLQTNEYLRPNGKRDLYFPLTSDDGRSSLQMLTAMDLDTNTLIQDEIVQNNRAYRLEQFQGDFYLPLFNGKISITTLFKSCYKIN